MRWSTNWFDWSSDLGLGVLFRTIRPNDSVMGRGNSMTQSSSGSGRGMSTEGLGSDSSGVYLSPDVILTGVLNGMGAFSVGDRISVSRQARKSICGMIPPRQPTRGFSFSSGNSIIQGWRVSASSKLSHRIRDSVTFRISRSWLSVNELGWSPFSYQKRSPESNNRKF